MGLMIVGSFITLLALASTWQTLYMEMKSEYIPCSITSALIALAGAMFFVVGGING